MLIILVLIVTVPCLLVLTAIFWWLWNATLPEVFGSPRLSFSQSLRLALLLLVVVETIALMTHPIEVMLFFEKPLEALLRISI